MTTFQKAKWIWVKNESLPNTYGEFYDEFIWNGEQTQCLLSCDSDYTLFINGQFVSSNQYGDFPWYKSYDRIDVTPYLQQGKNAVAILVWHFGVGGQRYFKSNAGLVFELRAGEKVLLASGENTRARYSKAFHNGAIRTITPQLGFTFAYDMNQEDGWQTTGAGFVKATLVEKTCTFVARPTGKLQFGNRTDSKILKNEGNYYLIDLGKETVGVPVLEFSSPVAQKLQVAWGEDLQDGHVRQIVEHRGFSFDLTAKPGDNAVTNYMLRLGCRYLEIYAESPIQLHYAGLIHQYYPLTTRPAQLENALDQSIYDTCVQTLKNCIMEHYVDTPWREQCFYVFDSRNQIMCGYKAFENGNAEYARANLRLMSKDKRDDGLLAICAPCGEDLTIPSFTLYYFMAVQEYLEQTSDTAFAEELYDRLQDIIGVFARNRRDGLVNKFEGETHWNFYDWTPYMEGVLRGTEAACPDLMANLLFILALEHMQKIDAKLGKVFLHNEMLQETRVKTRETFYKADRGLFSMTPEGEGFTVLGNALAVLMGLTDVHESAFICDKLVGGELVDCTLSMKCFQYDALLKTDKEKWQPWILQEIRKNYSMMLDNGATTFWETIDGASAFGNAGSLCHGWSAIPIYYYHLFGMVKGN